ncbi:MAG: hypothetical protein MR030_01605 [Bacteroidales bacterium]|nr:hypothetical protein [Bacteroidales bacterium]
MTGSEIFRFACIALLWVLLVVYILMNTPQITLWIILMIVFSGIIVFVPLYKKYKREHGGDDK